MQSSSTPYPDNGGQPTGNAGQSHPGPASSALSNNGFQNNQQSDFTPFPVPPPADAAPHRHRGVRAGGLAIVVAILVAVLIAAMYVRYSYARYDKFMECCDCGGCLRFYCGGKTAKPDESGSGYGTLQD